jgi:hypothetical protein
LLKASGATASLALHPHPKPAVPPQCHDRRHRLSPHTARRQATPRALYRYRPTVSKGTRRIIDHAKIAPSTIAPAPKSLLPSSCCRRPRQSAHLPPEPPHPQIPIVVNRQPGGPRVPSWEAFGRRPSEPARISATGLHPKPYTKPRHSPQDNSAPWRGATCWRVSHKTDAFLAAEVAERTARG